MVTLIGLRGHFLYSSQTIRPFMKARLKPSRAFSTHIEHNGYHNLIQSTEWEKVDRICRAELKCSAQTIFPNQDVEVSPAHLQLLLSKVNRVATFSVYRLDELNNDERAIHFRENKTFINLPYGSKVSTWPDRNALQKLIRSNFTQIFHPEDLVIIPGCAEGQIPIEIAAHNSMHDYQLHVVAADYNVSAMNLGYLTMKSYGIDPSRVAWVQADVTKKLFFEWVHLTYPSKPRHHVVTLIQPSLRENTLLSFLKNSSSMSQEHELRSTVVMPILLMDVHSEWYQRCDSFVKRALQSAEERQEAPQLIWNKTKYGMEFLRLNAGKTDYVPQQYFVYPESVKDIQKETGHQNASLKLSDLSGEVEENMGGYPIHEGLAKRVLCLWDSIY